MATLPLILAIDLISQDIKEDKDIPYIPLPSRTDQLNEIYQHILDDFNLVFVQDPARVPEKE